MFPTQVVGPGSYGELDDHTLDHAYAPFSSTAERQLGGNLPSTFGPGPGSYKTKKTDWEIPRRDVSSGNFVSGVARLAKDTSSALTAPGPGSYSGGSKWIKNTHRYKMEPQARRITFQRMPTAPSVPVRSQSYGYEESGTGELILQKAPMEGHSGRGSDSVGPCVYEPLLTAVKTSKTTDFKSSKSSRGIFTVNANPGPGQYKPKLAGQDIIMEVNERVGTQLAAREASRKGEEPEADAKPPPQMSSNFASKVPNEETAVPGPGSYNNKTQFRTKSVPEHHQFFTSSSRRSYEVDVQTQLAAPTWATNPGPGQYEDKRTSFANKVPGVSAPTDDAPFKSTSRRFAGEKAKAGPAFYHIITPVPFPFQRAYLEFLTAS